MGWTFSEFEIVYVTDYDREVVSSRVTDLGGVDPDPVPILKEKRDPDPT